MKVEVKETQSQEVDWTKNPQLVVDEAGGIVLVEKSNETMFIGTVIKHADGFADNTGMHSTLWVKSHFKPFHGEITLKND